MKVKLLRDWTNPADARRHAAGAVIEIDDAKGATLIEIEAAEKVADASDVKSVVDEAVACLRDGVQKAVADAVKEAASGVTFKGLRIEAAKDMREDDPLCGFENENAYYKAVKRASMGMGLDERLKVSAGAGKAQGSLLSGEEGAFLAPVAVSDRIFERVVGRIDVLSLCDRITVNGFGGVRIAAAKDDDKNASATRHGGVVVYNVAEAGSITTSRMAWREITLMPHKKAALCPVTDEMLETVANFGSRLTAKMGDAIADEVTEDVMFGSGAGVCLGAFKSDCCVVVDKEADQPADTIWAKNIVNMEAYCSGEGEFWYHPECHTQLALLTLTVGTSGIPLMLAGGGFTNAPFTTIRGRRATKTDHCEKLGDSGDIVLGDFSQYALCVAGSTKTDMSIHLYFDQAMTAFRAIFGVDGRPYWEKSLRPRKGATDTRISPFVKLAAR